MNIAIIDDISTDAEALKNIAVSYFEKKQIRAEICHFFSAEEFFEDYQPGKFQILFLDIYMDGMTGMEAARRIRRQSDNCILVFVTTSSDFAVESYDVGAFLLSSETISARKTLFHSGFLSIQAFTGIPLH